MSTSVLLLWSVDPGPAFQICDGICLQHPACQTYKINLVARLPVFEAGVDNQPAAVFNPPEIVLVPSCGVFEALVIDGQVKRFAASQLAFRTEKLFSAAI